jgi:hypothetical protein
MYQSTVCPFAASSTASKLSGASLDGAAAGDVDSSEPHADTASAAVTRAAVRAVERRVICTPVDGLAATVAAVTGAPLGAS